MDAGEVDYLCSECGRVHTGPHTGLTFDDPGNVGHIDEAGQGFPTSPEHPMNVSHSYCDDCSATWLERERAAHAERQRQSQQSKRRFRRGRKDA